MFGAIFIIYFIFAEIKNRQEAPFVLYIFLIAFFSYLINTLLGPITCIDGWHSPSIGSQGACSYHGGVENRGWIGPLSFLLTIFISSIYYHFKEIAIKKWTATKKEN